MADTTDRVPKLLEQVRNRVLSSHSLFSLHGDKRIDWTRISRKKVVSVAVWYVSLVIGIFLAYFYLRKYETNQHFFQFLVPYFAVMVLIGILCLLVFTDKLKVRDMTIEFLLDGPQFEDDKKEELEKGAHFEKDTALLYNTMKLWLLTPLFLLGIWAPPRVPIWIRGIHIGLSIIAFLSVIAYEIIAMAAPNANEDRQDHFVFLVFECFEMSLFLIATFLVFNQPVFVEELFKFDNTIYDKDEQSTGVTPNLDDQVHSESYPQALKDIITSDIISEAWDWVLFWGTPAVLFTVIAYFASLTLDMWKWEGNYGFSQYLFNLSPLGGSDFFVKDVFISGSIFVISFQVWFICYTVSMELNRIADQTAKGKLVVWQLFSSIRRVRHRLSVLARHGQRIITVQVVFTIVLMFLVAFRYFWRASFRLPVRSAVSLGVVILVMLKTIFEAARITQQYQLIVDVVTALQEQHMCDKNETVDLTNVIRQLESSPMGFTFFELTLNDSFMRWVLGLVLSGLSVAVARALPFISKLLQNGGRSS